MVLARLPDAPAGTRGISLFLVPKFLPDAEGRPGERNGVYCDAIGVVVCFFWGCIANATLRAALEQAWGSPAGEAYRIPGRDVRHDEFRAAGHRRAGPGADRDRLAEIAGLRRRAPAIARAGAGEGGHAGRSHPAAAGRAAHVAHAAGLGAGRAHVPVLAGLADRRRAACAGPGRARPRGRPAEPADAGGQGLRVRQRRRVGEPRDAGPWRQRLHRRIRHRADAARRASRRSTRAIRQRRWRTICWPARQWPTKAAGWGSA